MLRKYAIAFDLFIYCILHRNVIKSSTEIHLSFIYYLETCG